MVLEGSKYQIFRGQMTCAKIMKITSGLVRERGSLSQIPKSPRLDDFCYDIEKAQVHVGKGSKKVPDAKTKATWRS